MSEVVGRGSQSTAQTKKRQRGKQEKIKEPTDTSFIQSETVPETVIIMRRTRRRKYVLEQQEELKESPPPPSEPKEKVPLIDQETQTKIGVRNAATNTVRRPRPPRHVVLHRAALKVFREQALEQKRQQALEQKRKQALEQKRKLAVTQGTQTSFIGTSTSRYVPYTSRYRALDTEPQYQTRPWTVSNLRRSPEPSTSEDSPPRSDLLVSMMEFWHRLHSLNDNVNSMLRELRRGNAVDETLAAGKTIAQARAAGEAAVARKDPMPIPPGLAAANRAAEAAAAARSSSQ